MYEGSKHYADMTETIPQKLRSLTRRAGLSMERLARAMGYSHASGIQRYLSDNYSRERLDLDIALKFVRGLAGRGVPPITETEILRLTGIEQLLPPSNATRAPDHALLTPQALPVDVPVLGVAACGTEGDFSLNGETVNRVRRPPGLADNRAAFAVYVRGSSMEPRHYQGDLLYVDPLRPARSGDDVLVELRPDRPGEPGAAYIKQLVSQTPLRIILRQFEPAEDFAIPGNRILRVSKILSLSDLLGA